MPRLSRAAVLAAAVSLVVSGCAETPIAPAPTTDARAALVSTGTLADLVVTEIMPDPVAVADASGEWFEMYNTGAATLNLKGMRYRGNTNADTFSVQTDLLVGPQGYVVFGINNNSATNGGVTVHYKYPSVVNLNNSGTDSVRITAPDGTLIDRVIMTTPRPAGGASGEVIDAIADNVGFMNCNWRAATQKIQPAGPGNDLGTPGSGGYAAQPAVASIAIAPTDPTVFVATTQPFTATLLDANGNPAGVATWSSSDGAVASIGCTGAANALAQGTTTITASWGSVSASTTLTVVADVGAPALAITELLADPGAVGDAEGEWFEVQNVGTSTVDLFGIRILSNNTSENHVITQHVNVAPGGFAVLGANADPNVNGGVTVQYAYGSTITIANSGTAERITLQWPDGRLIDEVVYSGLVDGIVHTYAPKRGVSRALIDPTKDNLVAASANWRESTETFGAGDKGTPGAQTTIPPDPNIIVAISIGTNFPAEMPAGYTKPTFPTAINGSGTAVANQPAFSWSSVNPQVATVDQRGYVTGVAAGTATIEVTGGGITGSLTFTILSATAPTDADYGNHLSFGTPADANSADDILLVKPQFALSFNPTRGSPNWVSWTLNATHFGTSPRCNCFTTDAALTALGVPPVHDFDYRDSGYDRGHMVQSDSRSTTAQENAATFLLSQIVPQAPNNNQGPWAKFENELDTLALVNGKEVYLVAGGEFSATPATLKNEGKVAIPEFTWKVAVIMDRGETVDDVHSWTDLEVIAVRMPNLLTTAADIRNLPWETYITTVDAIEAATGYDLLAALPDLVERVVEANDHPPVAVVATPAPTAEGAVVQLDASGSTDPDAGDVLTYSWVFGDGTTGTGVQPTHTYRDNGTFTVTVTVTDSYGAYSSASTTATVTNVAPQITAFTVPFGNAHPVRTELGIRATYTDAGAADTHHATITWGDGTSSLVDGANGAFTATHRYARAGFYRVATTLTDDDGGIATARAEQPVVVFDADAGFVTGGGFLDRAEGKTHFNIDLRYTGARTPAGKFDIDVQNTTFAFAADRFDWLVITDGTIYAQGHGRTAGGGEDLIVNLVARDGDGSGEKDDFLRVVITRANGTVVFDTDPGAPPNTAPTRVGGGNIQLHR